MLLFTLDRWHKKISQTHCYYSKYINLNWPGGNENNNLESCVFINLFFFTWLCKKGFAQNGVGVISIAMANIFKRMTFTEKYWKIWLNFTNFTEKYDWSNKDCTAVFENQFYHYLVPNKHTSPAFCF